MRLVGAVRLATIKTVAPTSTALYSNAGLNAIPRLAGNVHGVVVQMMMLHRSTGESGIELFCVREGEFDVDRRACMIFVLNLRLPRGLSDR
jgi:hypothetical protein